MIRFHEINAHTVRNGDIQNNYLVLDRLIWQRGREYFKKHIWEETVWVLDEYHNPVCFAWQDQEAKREIRMLRELEGQENMLDFRDIYPDVSGVTIYGCNELAYVFAKYLLKRGIAVNVIGKMWEAIGSWEKYKIPLYQNYKIYAEGIHQKEADWENKRLRSVSAEFECIDKIYEANIKAGKIKDADGSVSELLERLKKEKQIVIRGTGTKAQDVLDWLCDKGIDICAFQSDRVNCGRKNLFGKPVYRKSEVSEYCHNALIIECSSKYSAWGFGDVDAYDYEGYERNKKYLLLRDYIDVPQNNLIHVFAGMNLVFVGDISLCSRAYNWWKLHGLKIKGMEYWDLLGEHENKTSKIEIQKAGSRKLKEKDVCILITPKYCNANFMTEEAAGKFDRYIRKLSELDITDYTDYFIDINKCIHLENESIKYHRKELRPQGILLGAIPSHCGNVLVRQSLEGHSQIIMIEEHGFFNNNLYFFCIRLAEEKADDILFLFWEMYKREVKTDGLEDTFVDKEKFNCKMRELLKLEKHFTSQELFVMFHIAYQAMYDKEIHNINNIIIYWEPHQWERILVRELAYWLGSRQIMGFTLSIVRNRYILAGSYMRDATGVGYEADAWMYVNGYIPERRYQYWEECVIKFEELKCKPKDVLGELCSWIGIPFQDILMETTWHGENATYDGIITGFDIKPAYNLYEEYFSAFDRMRICIAAASYQRQYGYPYVNCLDFSRCELQEMFLKEFRWADRPEFQKSKTKENIWRVQQRIRHLLWRERFSEVMKIRVDEEL